MKIFRCRQTNRKVKTSRAFCCCRFCLPVVRPPVLSGLLLLQWLAAGNRSFFASARAFSKFKTIMKRVMRKHVPSNERIIVYIPEKHCELLSAVPDKGLLLRSLAFVFRSSVSQLGVLFLEYLFAAILLFKLRNGSSRSTHRQHIQGRCPIAAYNRRHPRRRLAGGKAFQS